MRESKSPSRRKFITSTAVALGSGVAVAQPVHAATEKILRPKLVRAGKSTRLTQAEVLKDKQASQAEALLRRIDPGVEIHWVKGTKKPGARRIIQMVG